MANTSGMKYGGRQKGTPNRLTKELRTILKDVLYYELEKIEELLESLEPKERLELVIKYYLLYYQKWTKSDTLTMNLLM